MSATDDRLLSLEDVADRLQVSDQSVRRWIKAGKLAAYKPGLEWRIRPSALEDFLETHSSPKVQAALPSDDSPAAWLHPTDRETQALGRWLSYLERRLDEHSLTRDELAHELDAATAAGIKHAPAEYPDEQYHLFMRLVRRALEEAKSFDALQAEAASLTAEFDRMEEVHAQGQERRA
jgi:excisionase family DNA binding protein